jgi:hypothetical protein
MADETGHAEMPTVPVSQPKFSDVEAWDWYAFAVLGAVFILILVALLKGLLSAGTIDMIFGTLLAWVSAIVYFRWGSSNGSKAKDATIAKLADKNAPPTV